MNKKNANAIYRKLEQAMKYSYKAQEYIQDAINTVYEEIIDNENK